MQWTSLQTIMSEVETSAESLSAQMASAEAAAEGKAADLLRQRSAMLEQLSNAVPRRFGDTGTEVCRDGRLRWKQTKRERKVTSARVGVVCRNLR